MPEVPFALALRLPSGVYALEPGRDYLLGKAPECDLRLGARAAPHHARLGVRECGIECEDLGTGLGTWRNGERLSRGPLMAGDTLRFGGEEASVVPDLGDAQIVPIPALREEARRRRLAAMRIAAAGRRVEPEAFQDLMAHELRRAPWLALSGCLHALALLLLLLLVPTPPPGGRAKATVHLDVAGENILVGEAAPPLPTVQPEPADEAAALPALDDPSMAPPAVAPPPLPDRAADALHSNPRLARRSATSGDEAKGPDAGIPGSGGFRQTVGELRRSGLEIVFVFDSTGSMTRTIQSTKATLVQMLEVLRELVPDARVGLVTFRDRGAREAYRVRETPLGLDFWRAANFVQFVVAEGGGDRPEDVRAGLAAAFAQRWSPNARRVVVLAGDAPPHDEDWKSLLAEVQAFSRNGRSFVHTIVTSPDRAGPDTRQCFTAIAKAGKGSCTDMDGHDRILQRVLSLAFGREFDQDLAAVTEAVQAQATRVEVRDLALARDGGEALTRALRQQPVPHTLMNALVRRPRRAVAQQLVDELGRPDTPAHTRQAIAWVLQRVLDLSLPPVDPSSPESPQVFEQTRLRQIAQRLPE